jgi:cell division protein FtsZ
VKPPSVRSTSPVATATATETSRPAVVAAKAEQNEFLFHEHESRGYFDKTDRNLFEGQDLDVPTYLRKGIKITV